MTKDQQTQVEAAAFRSLVAHLQQRSDVQNIDLMNLAGFCRNCLWKWYSAEARKIDPDFEQAEATFGKVLQLDPDNSNAQTGMAQVRQNQRDAAEAMVTEASQALAAGDLLRAETAYDKALSLDPERADAAAGLS